MAIRNSCRDRTDALLEGFLAHKEPERYRIYKKLLRMSETDPRSLYPKWGFFAELLKSEKPTILYVAVNILARLAKVDRDKKFERLFSRFYSLLDHESVIPAGTVVANSGRLARYKPALRERITARVLKIDQTRHSASRKDLIKGYLIRSLDQYFAQARNKRPILDFVRAQLQSSSPQTRKEAKAFLKKYEAPRG